MLHQRLATLRGMRKTLTSGLLVGTLLLGAVQAPAASAAADEPSAPVSADARAAEWVDNLTIPDTANPRDLTKQELAGFRTMTEGLLSGDAEKAASGLGQAVSVILAVFVSVVVVGQLVELVMRGIRNAGR